NSVLNGVPAGASGEDTYRLGDLNVAADGACAVRVREAPDHAAALDAAQLLVVDHPSEVTPYWVGGAFVLGTRQSAARITTGDGSDLTTTLAGGGAYTIGPEDTLTVDLGPGGGGSPVIIAASGWGSLALQVSGGQGGRQPAARCYPRSAPDELALAAPGADAFRLVCDGSASLSFVGRLAVSPVPPTVRSATLLSGQDTRIGEVKAAVAAPDSVSATLIGPDTLALAYVSPPLVQGSVRDHFLVLEAIPLNPQTLAPLALRPAREDLPVRFALYQNQPNPFGAVTTIRFDLPVGAPVRLEVFDAQGRKLTTLANRYFPPGYHAVTWKPAATGRSVGPGVYFYRIEAGPFRERRKMVVLP
ncbi:MAG: T9SS type A sorting domain-containing protein, partial [Candidatus Eisenbacteria bacterium]|nr:T9SS type A sorting domain-containing protein [Candidatus Eisenbacteria bacterium]